MQALRLTQSVAQDGLLHVAVPPEMGRKCEVIVFPCSERLSPELYNIARMQEQSGFAQKVLGSDSEDVWNDL